MNSIHKDIEEFHRQLKNGTTQRAYKALLTYMMGLQTHFKKKYPDSSISAFYQGYMDMSYFAISPPSLKKHDLKCAIVFNYETFRFEAWLAGRNRSVNRKYWELFKEQKLPEYRIVTPAKGVDSIIECDLSQEFDCSNTEVLTTNIEKRIRIFIKDIERFLSKV